MTAPGNEKEWRTNDNIGANDGANAPEQEEPVATEPLQQVGTEKELNVDSQSDSDKDFSRRAALTRSQSEYTQASESAFDSQSQHQDVKRSWGERLNPLKAKNKPPIPKERKVSREYNAGFLSKLTFQWMAPLMQVSLLVAL